MALNASPTLSRHSIRPSEARKKMAEYATLFRPSDCNPPHVYAPVKSRHENDIYLSFDPTLSHVRSVWLLSQHCYMQYRNLWPKRDPVGLLTGIRASLEFRHDPNDPNLSDECRRYFKHFKLAGMVTISTTTLLLVFILLVRSFGLQEVLNQ